MAKIGKKSKVTLTIGQLKRLVAECDCGGCGCDAAPVGGLVSTFGQYKQGEPILGPDNFVMPGGRDGKTPKQKKRKALNATERILGEEEEVRNVQRPVVDLGNVLRMGPCQKQQSMCWNYTGYVFVHKTVNPTFIQSKPYLVIINQNGKWQMHFENFGTQEKNEAVLDELYKAVAALCKEKHLQLWLVGGATPGGISGFSNLAKYGFKKRPVSYKTNVYWGGELDYKKLDDWLHKGTHNNDFLVKNDDGEWVSPDEYDGEISASNTKPKPFVMVAESTARKITFAELKRIVME